MEVVLKRTSLVSGALTFVAVGLAVNGSARAGWGALVLLYLTGVTYGMSEMTLLFRRHRRRCQECLHGTGARFRWWAPRAVLVLAVSLLPVLLLLPMLSGRGG